MTFKEWLDAVLDIVEDEDMIVAYYTLLRKRFMENIDYDDAADEILSYR